MHTKQDNNCFFDFSSFLLFSLSSSLSLLSPFSLSLSSPFSFLLFIFYFSFTHSVPPIVISLAPDQEVIGNETGSATLSFRIDNAAPPVLLQGLQWFYAANFSSDPSVRQEITNFTNRTTNSTLTFSDFLNMRYINLTVSNIAQRRTGIGGETDEGRYFLVATNPAGVSSSYIDLVVFGMYIMYVRISSLNIRTHLCMMYVYVCVCTSYTRYNNYTLGALQEQIFIVMLPKSLQQVLEHTSLQI